MSLELTKDIERKIEEAIVDENWAAIADLVCSKEPLIHQIATDHLYTGDCSITLEQRKQVEDLY